MLLLEPIRDRHPALELLGRIGELAVAGAARREDAQLRRHLLVLARGDLLPHVARLAVARQTAAEPVDDRALLRLARRRVEGGRAVAVGGAALRGGGGGGGRAPRSAAAAAARSLVQLEPAAKVLLRLPLRAHEGAEGAALQRLERKVQGADAAQPQVLVVGEQFGEHERLELELGLGVTQAVVGVAVQQQLRDHVQLRRRRPCLRVRLQVARHVLAVEQAEGVARRLLDVGPLVVHPVRADGDERAEGLEVVVRSGRHVDDHGLAHLVAAIEHARGERCDEGCREGRLLDDELDCELDGDDAHLGRNVLGPAEEGDVEERRHLLRQVALGQQEELPEQPRAVQARLLVLHGDHVPELGKEVGDRVGRDGAELEQQAGPLLSQLGGLALRRARVGRHAALQEAVQRRLHLGRAELQEALGQLVRGRPLAPLRLEQVLEHGVDHPLRDVAAVDAALEHVQHVLLDAVGVVGVRRVEERLDKLPLQVVALELAEQQARFHERQPLEDVGVARVRGLLDVLDAGELRDEQLEDIPQRVLFRVDVVRRLGAVDAQQVGVAARHEKLDVRLAVLEQLLVAQRLDQAVVEFVRAVRELGHFAGKRLRTKIVVPREEKKKKSHGQSHRGGRAERVGASDEERMSRPKKREKSTASAWPHGGSPGATLITTRPGRAG